MLIHSVIKRLREVDSPMFKDKVAGAIDYFSMKTGGGLKPPALYVIEGAQQIVGTPTGGAQTPKQFDWRHTFMVSAIAKPPCTDGDYTQAWAADAVYPIRCVLWGALMGWRPHQDFSPIMPVSVLIGKGGEDAVEIMFTFTTEEMVGVPRISAIPENAGQLQKFGVAMQGMSFLTDMCSEVPDCEIETNAGDTSRDC